MVQPPGRQALAAAAPADLRDRAARHPAFLVDEGGQDDFKQPIIFGALVALLLGYRLYARSKRPRRRPAIIRLHHFL